MKTKKKLAIVGAIFVIVILLIITYKVYEYYSLPELTYNIEESMHGTFYIENNVVVIADVIVVKNNTKKDLNFYMYADVTEDKGLVVEDFAPACKKDSLEKEKYSIKAKSETRFVAYFKAKKGDKTTKYDRLPPNDIKFEITK